MTVSNTQFAKAIYQQTKALGEKAVSSDAWMEIEDFEGLSVLIKQFPWPVLSPAGEIEIPMALGIMGYQPQQVKFNQQGAVTFAETKQGSIARFLEELNNLRGGVFNARVYEGTPDSFTRSAPILHCFVQVDNPDRDFENRSQILTFTGTMFYNFFGYDE